MKTVEHPLQGNAFFQRTPFKTHGARLPDLVARGQQPGALFSGCADSRAIPSRATNAPPGQPFVLRNAGDCAAPHKPDGGCHAAAAGIACAVTALNPQTDAAPSRP